MPIKDSKNFNNKKQYRYSYPSKTFITLYCVGNYFSIKTYVEPESLEERLGQQYLT